MTREDDNKLKYQLIMIGKIAIVIFSTSFEGALFILRFISRSFSKKFLKLCQSMFRSKDFKKIFQKSLQQIFTCFLKITSKSEKINIFVQIKKGKSTKKINKSNVRLID